MVDIELGKELLGLDLSSVNFKKAENKNLSYEALFGVSQETPTKFDQYLKERGFTDVLNNATSEFKKDYAKTLMSAEAELGTEITIETVEDSKITGLIRSQESKGNLLDLFNYIQEQNEKISSNVIVETNIPIKPLTFNRIIEGKYKITHVAFDTEADKEGHTILNTAVNWEAKRIVVGYHSEKYELFHFETVEGWKLYYLGTQNLWEACLAADMEALIAATLTSALEQGSIETLSLYKKLFPEPIIVNLDLLAEYLNNQRKGAWIPHNNFYDINQLNALYKHKKGKRRKFNIVKTKELEFIKIRFQQEDLYTIKLGNTFVGWRFNTQSNTRYSFFGLPQITVAPSQTMSFSFVNGIDTLNLAFAGRFKSKKLEDLSEGLVYEKTKIKDEKIFSKADLEFTSDFKITEKLHYNIMDCCATLATYSMLSYHFNLDEIGKLLEIDLSVTKNWHRPFISSIVSPATISKFVFDIYLQSITGLSKHEIEANLELSRQYLLNFKKTYLGGRNEGFVFGTVENKDNKIIKYHDFESQYPNASRLTQAALQLKLAAKGTLHEYLCYDKKSAIKDFWETAELSIRCKKNQTPLPDSFAEKILGNITFNYSKFKNILIRTRLSKRLQDIYINSGNKKTQPKKHKITLTMFDLLATIEYAHLIDKIPLDYLKKNIKVITTERLLLDKVKPFGKELFTKILGFRRVIKERWEKAKDKFTKTKLGATEQNLKYVMNSGYGLTTEGISKDYIGKYQVLSIGCLISACSRFFNYSAEILYRYYKETPIYSDTDSIISLAKPKIHDLVKKFFEKTIELKEDTEYGEIEKIHVLGKKKYGILDKTGKIHCKIHGTAGYQNTEEVYQTLYKGIFDNKPTGEIVSDVILKHPIQQRVSYRREKDSKIKTIKAILKDGKVIKEFDINQLHIYVYQLLEKDSNDKIIIDDYLVINTTRIHKGSFGEYFNVKRGSNSKVVFAIFAPCNFQEIIDRTLMEIPEITAATTKETASPNRLIETLYYSLEPLMGSLTVSARIDEFSENVIIDEETFDTLEEYYPSLESFFRKSSGGYAVKHYKNYANALRRTLEKLSNVGIPDSDEEIDKDKWSSIIESLLEETINEDEFIETFARFIPSKVGRRLLNYHDTIKLYGLKIQDTPILNEIMNKEKLAKKFEKLIQYSKDRFHKDRIKLPNESYSILLPRKYTKTIKHDCVKEYRNNETFNCDGFSIAYSVNVPQLDFSTKLKSDELKYYSQAILNTSLTASNIFVDTHFSNKQKRKAKKEALLTTDPTKLPCPKTNKNVLIALKIIPKIDKDTTLIEPELFKLLFDPIMRKQLLTDQKDGKPIVLKPIEKIRTAYFVSKTGKFKQKLKKLYKHEWQEIDWFGKKWSVSIEQRQSLDYNAMLSLKILLNYSELGKRTFQASLRLNPSSKNLYNIDLFETSVKALDENTHIGKVLIQELFRQTLLRYFGQKRATHLEDLQKAKEPYEAYNLTYLALTAKILKRRSKQLRAKLGIIAYTKNIKTITPVKELVPILHSTCRDRIQKMYDRIEDPREQLEKMEEINVNSNRFSLGFNINNYKEKYTVSVYGKDYYQYLSKIKRISKHERIKDLPADKLIKIRHLRDIQEEQYTLRIEITIRGWEQIHTKTFFKYLNQIEKLIRKIDLKLSELDDNKLSRSENIKAIKDFAEEKLDKIEATLEIEIQDELQEYKTKEQQTKFRKAKPPPNLV